MAFYDKSIDDLHFFWSSCSRQIQSMNHKNGTATNNSQKKVVVSQKGSAFTKRGTMPPDKVAKYKLLPVIGHEFAPKYAMTDLYRKRIGRLIRLNNNLNVVIHQRAGVKLLPRHCPAQIKDAVHYFAHVSTKESAEG